MSTFKDNDRLPPKSRVSYLHSGPFVFKCACAGINSFQYLTPIYFPPAFLFSDPCAAQMSGNSSGVAMYVLMALRLLVLGETKTNAYSLTRIVQPWRFSAVDGSYNDDRAYGMLAGLDRQLISLWQCVLLLEEYSC